MKRKNFLVVMAMVSVLFSACSHQSGEVNISSDESNISDSFQIVQTVIETDTENKTESNPATDSETKPVTKSETEPETKPETETEPETKPETKPETEPETKPDPPEEFGKDLTTMEFVNKMGVGINLGNTMEACGTYIDKNGGVRAYETAWGSPEITKEIIQGYADCGFGVLRIPVAWSNLMEEDYTISPDLMNRVKEITQWTVDSGMYAIVNIHWDGGWWEKFPTDKENCMKKYTRVWEQITENFKDFGDKVIFESLNEEGCWNDVWNRYGGSADGKDTAYGLLNEINQKFVDIVRSSGGNNPDRHLLIAGYATDIDLTCDPLFVMPNDPKNRLAVSVHYYTPSTFCILEQDASWGKAQSEWGSEKDKKELNKYMDMIKTTFVDKGIPVIIGEYGVATKNKTPETVRLFLSSVAKEAKSRNICPVLWDTPGNFYNRYSYKFNDEELLKGIVEAAG